MHIHEKGNNFMCNSCHVHLGCLYYCELKVIIIFVPIPNFGPDVEISYQV